jgi:hypothetical protein
MEGQMSKKNFVIALAFAGICAATTLPARAEELGKAQLAQSLSTASVSLDQGLKNSESQGKPISGKFEMDGNDLRLSVYITRGGKFFELIVDHLSGFVKNTRAISDKENFEAVSMQSQIMKKAKVSLDKVVRDSVSENSGYRAISLTPISKANRPIAMIVLMKGTEIMRVFKPLD